MIVLFTDFGLEDPYTGQVKAVLQQKAPGIAVIDMFSNLPRCNTKAAAYLLPAYSKGFKSNTVFLCVVDPGVGSTRAAHILHADQQWFVGPDNGLLEIVMRRARHHALWRLTWQPEKLSNTFHGRDLFAPVAAMLAKGNMPQAERIKTPVSRQDFPDEMFEVVYIDHFGNAITGVRSAAITEGSELSINGHSLTAAMTFSDMKPGEAFWYTNSNGLIEISVNLGRACDELAIKVGDALTVA